MKVTRVERAILLSVWFVAGLILAQMVRVARDAKVQVHGPLDRALDAFEAAPLVDLAPAHREPLNVPVGENADTVAHETSSERVHVPEGSPYSIGCEFEDEVPITFLADKPRFRTWLERWWERGVEELLDDGQEPPSARPDFAAAWEVPEVRERWELAQGLGFLAHQVERYRMRERMRLDETGSGVNLEDELHRVRPFLERAGVGGLEFDEAATALSLAIARQFEHRDPVPQNLDEDTRLLEYVRTAQPIGSTPEERFLVESIRRAQTDALLAIGDELDRTTPGSSSRRALETHLLED